MPVLSQARDKACVTRTQLKDCTFGSDGGVMVTLSITMAMTITTALSITMTLMVIHDGDGDAPDR